MHVALSLILRLSLGLAVYSFWKLARLLYRQRISFVNKLPGPESTSWIYGNFREIMENENSVLHEKWVSIYGHTLKYKALFGMNRLFTVDTKALNHIVMNSHIYRKPEPARYALSQLLGDGVLVAEGEKHRQQRKIMNPAFGAPQIRELTEVFIEKAIELRDVWDSQVTTEGGVARIDALSWLSRTTLDVIGLAGFNYHFNAISRDPETNELNKAFATLFKSGTRMTLLPILRGMFPILRFLPAERDAETRQARKTMDSIGRQLLKDSKTALNAAKQSPMGKDTLRRRDLLTLLIKANMTTDHSHSQPMRDGEVLAQVPTFLVAGHETTSVGTTWALYVLTQHPRVQDKLRMELLTVPTDNPTMDELNALPYLDAVVREVMRVHAPVPSTLRVAAQDDAIPLEKPVKDKDGNSHQYIRVTKGQTIFVPILAINRSVEVWGNDATEFRPERWETIPEAASSIPGVWANLLTFMGGPRGCIGYRFSLVEMKALLFTLVRAFEFQLAVPPGEIKSKASIVQRPVLVSDPDGKNQMPLLVKPYQRS